MSVAIDTTLEAPFLGLRYFDEEQSHLFFGREVQASDILEKLRRSRLVTVMGSSGSGKSSLVRAGVVPGLKAGFLSDAGPRWRIVKMRPGSSPISNLGRELEKALSVPGLEVTLRRGPLGLIQAVEECRLPAKENVLVIADQFEELFRYQRESDHTEAAKEEAAAFVKLLLEATNQRALPIYVVVTMRSDYLGNCAQFRDLPERINDGLYLVPRMRRDQLEQAITGPVAVEDAAIAPRLVQKLLNDTGDDPDQLPVLQHALLRAWNTWKHAPRPLDLEDLDAVGGMKESLSRHADEIFEGLSADQQRIARVVFQQLSDRDTEGREIRRPAPVTHIAAVAGVTVQAVEEIVSTFATPEAALLYRNEDGHLDITHESLIRKWRLIQGTKIQGAAEAKGWLQEEVEARDQFQLLVERARKKDTLMGRALEDALRWRALGLNADWARRYTTTTGTNTTFHDVLVFVEECRTKEVRGRRLRNWLAVGALVAVAVFLAVIVVFWRSAERQTVIAEQKTAAARVSEGLAKKALEEMETAQAQAVQFLRAQLGSDDLALVVSAIDQLIRSHQRRTEDVLEWIPDAKLGQNQWFASLALELYDVVLRDRVGGEWAARTRAVLPARVSRARHIGPPPSPEADDRLNRRVLLNGGSFLMGSPPDVGSWDERPQHRVTLSSFRIQEHEVTNAEYRHFDPMHDRSSPDDHSVVNVSWYDAMAYAAWLGGSLPTEAQWEFAARGGGEKARTYPWGEESPTCERANSVDCGRRIAAVKTGRERGRTPEGVYDLAGNVWEWCRDWAGGPYRDVAQTDPQGPATGELRVLRGGSFYYSDDYLRAANRYGYYPDNRDNSYGFRVVSSRLRR